MDYFTDLELIKIKEFYTTKKEKFANVLEPEYYANRKNNGETYGYTLAKPYTEEEISTFEEKYDIKLDHNLKLYLLKVSRELFVAYYPNVFHLFVEGSCFIPEDKSLWYADECHIHGHYTDCTCEDNFSGMEDGMCEIGEKGCSFSDLIVVKGNNCGKIWNSDGDCVYKQNTTFRQYVMKEIEPKNDLYIPLLYHLRNLMEDNHLLNKEGNNPVKLPDVALEYHDVHIKFSE